jgi:hypothetical protein
MSITVRGESAADARATDIQIKISAARHDRIDVVTFVVPFNRHSLSAAAL